MGASKHGLNFQWSGLVFAPAAPASSSSQRPPVDFCDSSAHDTPTETCRDLPRGVSAARAEASRGVASSCGCPRMSRPTTWRPSGRRRPASTSSPRAEMTTFALGGKGPRRGNGFHRRPFQLVLVARAVRGPHSDDLARTEALVPPRHMHADVVRL